MNSQHTVGFGNSGRSSSRVLKPPGGGFTDFFSPADEIKPSARPKYDQQNSSNLNFCMNTVDPNEKVVVPPMESDHADAPEALTPASNGNSSVDAATPVEANHEQAAAQQQNLPKYHHHRSTALW